MGSFRHVVFGGAGWAVIFIIGMLLFLGPALKLLYWVLYGLFAAMKVIGG